MERHTGVVKSYNEKRGYGIISTPEQDYRFRYYDIDLPGYATVEDGQIVDFDVADGTDMAEKVTPTRVAA